MTKNLFGISFLALGLTCQFAAAQTTIVDDTWADGNRTSSGADGGGIDSPWYSSTGASLTATTGSMSAAVASASSLTFWTYFAPSGSPIQLGIGDTIQATFAFNVSGVGAQNASRGFNFGLFDSSAGTRRTTDGGSPGGASVIGYRQNMNFGSTFGVVNALNTQARTVTADANLLSTSADYSNVSGNPTGGGNAVAATGFASSTAYTGVFSVQRTSASLITITTTFSGTGLNGTGSITETSTDNSYLDSTFDTFAFRPTTGASTATTFNFTEFKVEVTAVPEPSTLALAGLGVITLAGVRRWKR